MQSQLLCCLRSHLKNEKLRLLTKALSYDKVVYLIFAFIKKYSMKFLVLVCCSFLAISSYSQKVFDSKSGIYNFKISDKFISQLSNNERNEFVFTDKDDTTSLVVNVNDRPVSKSNLSAFKKASNTDIEKKYFVTLKNPQILKRGELDTYPDQTIFFHLTHSVSSEKENDYMMTYIFYHKGKEINFIFRTKERRLANIFSDIETIVNSVKLL